jgi:hypothetical protein
MSTPTQTLGTGIPASANSTRPPDLDIVIAIIGVVLTLASVIVALLQYRSQRQRLRDAEREGVEIELSPRPFVRREGGSMAAPQV